MHLPAYILLFTSLVTTLWFLYRVYTGIRHHQKQTVLAVDSAREIHYMELIVKSVETKNPGLLIRVAKTMPEAQKDELLTVMRRRAQSIVAPKIYLDLLKYPAHAN